MERVRLRHVTLNGAYPAHLAATERAAAWRHLMQLMRGTQLLIYAFVTTRFLLFTGFKAFQRADIGPLEDFTCIIGCNGHGKRSASSAHDYDLVPATMHIASL